MRTMRTESDENIGGDSAAKKKKGWYGVSAIIVGALLFAVLLAVDLVTKYLATEYLKEGESKQVIPRVLYFTLTYNKGIAFGFLSNTEAAMVVVTALTVIIMIGVAVVFIKTGKRRGGLKIILAFIEAGAVGNLVDRIMMFSGNLKGVRDFLDISRVQLFSFINGGFNFGICNPADFYVTLAGVALFIYVIAFFITDGKESAQSASPKAERAAILTEGYAETDVSALEETSVEFDEDEKASADDESESAEGDFAAAEPDDEKGDLSEKNG